MAFTIFSFERYVILSAVNIDVSFSLLLTHMKFCTIVYSLGELREKWQKIFCKKMF